MDQRDCDLRSNAIKILPTLGPSVKEILFARLFIGLIVLICAEVFSGAILPVGLWHPMTWLFPYWLYFSHFFFLTTLAVWTGRTSLCSLYLWGILFGLYESWITKVIWAGYNHNGKPIMGFVGPYGFAEISMVVIFHPVMSFILPLAVTCLLCPSLRQQFPSLAWLTGKSRKGRVVQAYLVFTFIQVMAMNSGGPINLALNLALALVLLWILSRLAKPALSCSDGQMLVVFRRKGFVSLCVYLVLLYGVTYFCVHPEGLPSMAVQGLTIVFYVLIVLGLWLHPRQRPHSLDAVKVEARELQLVMRLFAVLLVGALICSVFAGMPILVIPVALNFVVWTVLGVVLTCLAWVRGMRQVCFDKSQ